MASPKDPTPTLLLDRILDMLAAKESVSKLGDAELVDLVTEKVWAGLVLGSREELLLDELMTRFEKRAGIAGDGEGDVIP